MNRGYIKVWRKIEDSGIMGNADLCQLFLWLMLKASSRPRKQVCGGSFIMLKPGQVIVGRKKLAVDLGTTERKIRTSLATLENMEIIDQQTTNKFTIISLVNWDRYQSERNAGDQQPGQQTTSKRPASDQQTTTKQEVKKEEFKKEDPLSSGTTENVGKAPLSRVSPKEGSGEGDIAAEPGIEFQELRAYYSERGRTEGPLAGFAEYKQLRAARTWPGQHAVYQGIDALAAQDDDWKRGFAPGLGKFLRERQWRKMPVKSNAPARASPVAPDWARGGGMDATIARNMETAARVLARRTEGGTGNG